MSKHPKTEAKHKTSEQIRNEFNEVCFQLGQEIRNEIRAKDNQVTLLERQEQLEKAFNARMQYEQELKAQQAKAAEQKKAFDKAFEAKGATTTPEAPVENSTQS